MMNSLEREKRLGGSHHERRIIAIIILILIIAASAIYYRYYQEGLSPILPAYEGTIAIIRIEGYILEADTVNRYVKLINRAILDESIKGVVLLIDSGGGYADYVEEIYSDLLELNKCKPLVASAVRALSGGYYIAVACKYIYVQKSSFIGSVGAIGFLPPILIPSEITIESGPHKWTGRSILSGYYSLNRVVDNFVAAVKKGRGSKLKISETELRKATVYLGCEAIKLGLADGPGGLQKAISKAAEMAGLVKYRVEELSIEREKAPSKPSGNTSALYEGNITLEMLMKLHPPPSFYYIYLPSKAAQSEALSIQHGTESSSAGGEGRVLIDLSHGNRVSWWMLDILISELIKRNVTVSFVSDWPVLDSKLNKASCLIVVSPTEVYSADEAERIRRFVDEGGLLLLFFDPAWEYIGQSGLSQGIIAPIDSLSSLFGITFAKGYLYNEEEYFGIYRNIYVKEFEDTPLTQNLNVLVFFTATHIRSMGKGIAWTSNTTRSSISERAGRYATIAQVKRGNGTVIAFGDVTFLEEPHCYVKDNYRLIENIASIIAKTKPPKRPEIEKAEINEPILPPGTKKTYIERINGREGIVKWFKVNETEIKIERPNRTEYYFFTENGSLRKWKADSMECTFEDPLPPPPYPLTEGKKWTYKSKYTLIENGRKYNGSISGKEAVEGFEIITAENDEEYLCAKIRFVTTDSLIINGRNMTTITDGYYWVSSDAGIVKEEATIRYYMNGSLVMRQERTLILLSIEKGRD